MPNYQNINCTPKSYKYFESHELWQLDIISEIKQIATDFIITPENLSEKIFEIVLKLHEYTNYLDDTYKKIIVAESCATFQSVAIQYYDYIDDLQHGSSIYEKSNLTDNETILKAKNEYVNWTFVENHFKSQIDDECHSILAKINKILISL